MTRHHPTPITRPELLERRRSDDDHLASGVLHVLNHIRFAQLNRPTVHRPHTATDDDTAEGVLLVLRAINAHVNGDTPITAAAS